MSVTSDSSKSTSKCEVGLYIVFPSSAICYYPLSHLAPVSLFVTYAHERHYTCQLIANFFSMQNPKSEAEMEAQNQNSPTLADAQPSQKLPRQTTTQSSTKSNDTSSAEEPIALTRNFASKRSSFRANKMELQDSPTLSNKQLSQRQQLSTTSVKSTGQSNDTSAVGSNASSKKSFKSEVNLYIKNST